VFQQAIAQVLTPVFEPQFVETSYGFRPGRSAHDAIIKCQEYLEEGYVWAVDMDLEKSFNTVNQSKLIQVLSESIREYRRWAGNIAYTQIPPGRCSMAWKI